MLLGDDPIDRREPLLSRMLNVRDRYAGSAVALMGVDPARVHLYGWAAVEPTGDGDVVRVTGPVEKPSRENAPRAYAGIGRYVLDPAAFRALARTPPGRLRHDPGCVAWLKEFVAGLEGDGAARRKARRAA